MDESELRSRLRDDDAGGGEIDLDAVLRRSRSRRRPRVALVGGAAALLVVALAVPAVSALSLGGGAMTAGSAGSSASERAEDSGAGAAPDRSTAKPLSGDGDRDGDGDTLSGSGLLLRCGAAVPDPGGTGLTLVLRLDPPAGGASGQPLTGVATLTNTGSTSITGSTPAVAQSGLAAGGRFATVHTSPDIQSVLAVDLAPGAGLDIPVSLELDGCPAGAIGAGDYAAVAAVRVVLDSGVTRAVVSRPVDVAIG
ncbi:hypothetical protein [Schumannella sp. 10F1B-5-1]|uniref:hypothetical protein n=1 Tax=Schumannella sp. 10F1B-5-1 TaxID=2590780 RepID=UPI001131C20C|nr:hypothetical protein [Schumannella sp. 10F1B-5-1]TPW70659.1 hypothetical protein FJ658_10995 [Schumannella sp. 10F1B-5-1]